MASFLSFLITKKVPSRKTLNTLLSGPLTGLGVAFYSVLFLVAATVFTLLITLNNQHLVTVPARGGNLTEGVLGAPRFINPILAATETDRRLVSLVYANLPDITESYAVSPDGKEVIVTLHPNLKFDDGKPLTSADVVFTVQKMQDVTISSMSDYWEHIAIEAPDEKTVVFMLPTADTSFIERMAFYILPKHIWEPVSNEEFETAKQNLYAVGAGTFKVSGIAYENGLPFSVTLKRNKHSIGGAAYLRTLTIKTYANQAALLNAIRSKSIDFSYSVAPETIAYNVIPDSFTVASVPTAYTVNLYHNSSDTALSNPSTVTAITNAIDKKAIIDRVVYGYGTPLGVLSNPASADSTTKPLSIPGFSIAVHNDPQLLLAAQTLAQQLQLHGARVTVKAFDQGAFKRAVQSGGFSIFLARSTDGAIPSTYSVALPLYTEALPYVFNTATHTVITNALESPTQEYAEAKNWYTKTDKLWKWLRTNNDGK